MPVPHLPIMNWWKVKALSLNRLSVLPIAGPVIEVRPSLNQIDDLMEEIQQRIEKEERVLVHHAYQTHGKRIDRISAAQ